MSEEVDHLKKRVEFLEKENKRLQIEKGGVNAQQVEAIARRIAQQLRFVGGGDIRVNYSFPVCTVDSI
jgi:cell division protein FtsB